LQGALQAALADVAPRTDDVRPDLDRHGPVRGVHRHTPSVHAGASESPSTTSPGAAVSGAASAPCCGSGCAEGGASAGCGVSMGVLTYLIWGTNPTITGQASRSTPTAAVVFPPAAARTLPPSAVAVPRRDRDGAHRTVSPR